jgi:hypothetical protein
MPVVHVGPRWHAARKQPSVRGEEPGEAGGVGIDYVPGGASALASIPGQGDLIYSRCGFSRPLVPSCVSNWSPGVQSITDSAAPAHKVGFG